MIPPAPAANMWQQAAQHQQAQPQLVQPPQQDLQQQPHQNQQKQTNAPTPAASVWQQQQQANPASVSPRIPASYTTPAPTATTPTNPWQQQQQQQQQQNPYSTAPQQQVATSATSSYSPQQTYQQQNTYGATPTSAPPQPQQQQQQAPPMNPYQQYQQQQQQQQQLQQPSVVPSHLPQTFKPNIPASNVVNGVNQQRPTTGPNAAAKNNAPASNTSTTSASSSTAASSTATNSASAAQLAMLTHQLNNLPPSAHPWGMNHSHIAEPPQPTLFGNDQFTDEESTRIQHLLERKLAQEEMATRTGGGKAKLWYVETHQAINMANYIFDYGGWSSSIKEFTMDYQEDKGGRWSIGISCIVKVMLKDGTYHEDVGYGMCSNMPDRGAAIEKAKKEAASDALKRALRLYGNGLGNCIYDKQYLTKLTNGSIVTPPLDLRQNRAGASRKRNRFMPDSKEDIKQEQMATAAAASSTPASSASSTGAAASAGVSPKVSKTNVYANAATAAHQQQQQQLSAPASNPYIKSQTLQPPSHPQQHSPQQQQQQWNSPVVKSEMITSPVISSGNTMMNAPTPTSYQQQQEYKQQPPQQQTIYQPPQQQQSRFNMPNASTTAPPRVNNQPIAPHTPAVNQWQANAAATPTAPAPIPAAPATNMWSNSAASSSTAVGSSAMSLPLQSNFAHQVLQQTQPPPQHQSHAPSSHFTSVSSTQPSHHAQQQQHQPPPAVQQPFHASTTVSAPTNRSPHQSQQPQQQPVQRTSPALAPVAGHYTPPSSFTAPTTAGARAPITPPAAAAKVVESKVDNDLDDDLLLNIADHHSPKKPKEDQQQATTDDASNAAAPRQLQLDEQKENRPPSHGLNVPSPPNASTSQPTKPQQIFSMADLLDDHEVETANN